LNKLWHDVQNEETLICVKFGKDLFYISKVIDRKKWPSFLTHSVDVLEDQVQLQSDLRELEQWAADWGMQFSPSKCHVLSANKRSHRHQYFYELCGVLC